MPTPTEIRLKILDVADDSAFLFELLQGLDLMESRPTRFGLRRWTVRELHQPSDIDQTRDVLSELVREGYVVLYPVDGDDALSEEVALSVLRDDVNWTPPGPAGRDVLYEVGLTEAGEAEYFAEYRRAESRKGADHRARRGDHEHDRREPD